MHLTRMIPTLEINVMVIDYIPEHITPVGDQFELFHAHNYFLVPSLPVLVTLLTDLWIFN